MSDLQCAATVIVARHAEAEYESDLAWDGGGSLTVKGRQQAHNLASTIADRRIATIVCSDMSRAVQTAEIVAGVLGCIVRVRAGLKELGAGDLARSPYSSELFEPVFGAWRGGNLDAAPPGAESGSAVVRRMTAELDAIADEFRGETTLVISHGGAIQLALPRLARNVPDSMGWEHPLANCDTCELAVDADGWVLRTWPGWTRQR